MPANTVDCRISWMSAPESCLFALPWYWPLGPYASFRLTSKTVPLIATRVGLSGFVPAVCQCPSFRLIRPLSHTVTLCQLFISDRVILGRLQVDLMFGRKGLLCPGVVFAGGGSFGHRRTERGCTRCPVKWELNTVGNSETQRSNLEVVQQCPLGLPCSVVCWNSLVQGK